MTVDSAPVVEPDSGRLGRVRRYLRDHPWLVDVVIAVIYALNVLLAAQDPYQPLSALVAVALAALGGGALLLRRRLPVAVVAAFVILTAAALVASGQLGGTELGLAFALYAVAVARPAWQAWVATVVAVAVASAAVWAWQEDVIEAASAADGASVVMVDDRVASTFGVAALALMGLALGISVRLRRQRLSDLVERAAALERDRDRQAQVARAEERARISREMHDVVAHSVSVMVGLADGAAVALDRDPDRSRIALDELSRTGRTALADMRRVLGALADDEAPLEPWGEAHGLRDLLERFRAAGLRVHAEGLALDLPQDAGVRLALYRVVQESLTNVLRHAPGTSGVRLTLRHEDAWWMVEVVDDGAAGPRGESESEGAGMGLLGMRERVGLLGGTVEAGPAGDGWRVLATLPAEEPS